MSEQKWPQITEEELQRALECGDDTEVLLRPIRVMMENARANMASVGTITPINHPLVKHKIGQLRRAETSSRDFRQLVHEITTLMCYAATSRLPLRDVSIQTPVCQTTVQELATDAGIAIVPIPRSGLAMVDGMLELLPNAEVINFGMARDSVTAEAQVYFQDPFRLGDCSEREIFVVDAMIATGNSATAVISKLKEELGCHKIHFLCILSSSRGFLNVTQAHPDVNYYFGAIDNKLDEERRIVPGFGDAGNRLYGTK